MRKPKSNITDAGKPKKARSNEYNKLKKELSIFLKKSNETHIIEDNQDISSLREKSKNLLLKTEAIAYLTIHKAIGTGDIKNSKRLLTEIASKTMNVERVSIWLLSEGQDELRCISLYEKSKDKHSKGMVLLAKNYPEYFNTLSKKSIVSASDALKNKSTREFAKDYLIPLGITSMLDAIIFDDKGMGGVVCFEHTGKKRKWEPEDENFAKVIASLFMRVRAINDRKKAEEILRQKNDEYEAQNEEYQQLTEELKQSLGELAQAKERLESNEEQINTILNIVDEMVWSQDYSSDVPNYMSPSAKKIMGREAWEFYNNPQLWKDIIHPEDTEYVINELKNLNNRRYIELEYRIIHPNNEIKWVKDKTHITYDDKNKPKRLDGIVEDITTQKIAEERSQKQGIKLKTILRTMPDLLFVIDKNGFYQEVFTNDPNKLLIPEDEIAGVNAVDVFGEIEGKRHIEAFRKCLSTNKLHIIEYQVKEADKNVYYEARLSPLDKTNVLAIVRDITERKEYEAKLAHERDLLQYLMDNIPDAIYFKDKNNRYTRINHATAKIFGIDHREKATGKTALDFFDKEYADRIIEEEKSILQKGKSLIGNIENVDAPDGNIWILTSKVPLKDINGNIVGLVGVSRNITQLKEAQDKLELSEKLYRSVTDNAFDGIYLRNDKYFEYVNDRFCEILGYTKKELCSPVFDFKSLLDRKTRLLVTKRDKQIPAGMKIRNIYEGSVICKSGQKKEVEFSITLLSRDKENLILGVMRDITERKKNETLYREIEVTRKSAEFKQNFLANMSHEIRTPLTGIIGMIEMLDKTRLDSIQKNYLNILMHSTENLREIINQVLDFSKIEAGQAKLKLKAFDFKTLITNTRKIFSNLCDKEIKFESFVDPQIPQYIKADQSRIIQIINNLISNSIKFTERGKITLNAQLVEYNKTSGEILIKIDIIDTGIGIKPEKQKHIFTPFAQIDERDIRQYDGTGLGLSICKELVKLHGGEIGFESKYGTGSNFWFTFAAIKTSCKKDQLPDATKKDKKASKKSLRILFAEDKIINQKVVNLLLSSMGHKVTMANNGKDAIEKYKPGKFDLIIMDIQMPVMDGISATNKLKEMYKTLPPIVGLSANAFEGDREKYMKQGLDEYLTKPLKSEDFIELFQKLFKI